MEFITAQNLVCRYVDYDEQPNISDLKNVLDDVSFEIKKGEFVCILGHNGCGKSTLSKHLNAMLVPTSGKLYVDGIDTIKDEEDFSVRRKVGLVLQNPDNQLVASIVEEDVAFGPENLGIKPSEIRRRVDEALKAVDMYDYRMQPPHKLSGGQKQRVAIAGIIAMQPDCLVLDEPTAMLDPKGREEVMRTIHRLNKEQGITVVLITHYMEEAIDADRIFVMDDGKILTSGTPEEVFSQVELLKRHRLDVPQVTELCYKLRALGVDIDTLSLHTDECISKLMEVFS